MCFVAGHDTGIFDCSDRVVLFATFELEKGLRALEGSICRSCG